MFITFPHGLSGREPACFDRAGFAWRKRRARLYPSPASRQNMLLKQAGFELTSLTPTSTMVSVIEGRPIPAG